MPGMRSVAEHPANRMPATPLGAPVVAGVIVQNRSTRPCMGESFASVDTAVFFTGCLSCVVIAATSKLCRTNACLELSRVRPNQSFHSGMSINNGRSNAAATAKSVATVTLPYCALSIREIALWVVPSSSASCFWLQPLCSRSERIIFARRELSISATKVSRKFFRSNCRTNASLKFEPDVTSSFPILQNFCFALLRDINR